MRVHFLVDLLTLYVGCNLLVMDILGDIHLQSILSHLDLVSLICFKRTCVGYYSVTDDLMPKAYRSINMKGAIYSALLAVFKLKGSTFDQCVKALIQAYQHPFVFEPSMPVMVHINTSGELKAGLTSFLLRWTTGDFPSAKMLVNYASSWLSLIPLYTNRGQYLLVLYETKHYKHPSPDGSLFFADPIKTLNRELLPSGPLVCCYSKCDIPSILPGDLHSKIVAESANRPFAFYQVSAKTNYNFEKPFLSLLRWKVGDTTLTFVESPAVTPPVALPPS